MEKPGGRIVERGRIESASVVGSISSLSLATWGWWALAVCASSPAGTCYSLSPLATYQAVSVAIMAVISGSVAYLLLKSTSVTGPIVGAALSSGGWFSLLITHLYLGGTSSVVPLGGILCAAGVWTAYRYLLFRAERSRRLASRSHVRCEADVQGHGKSGVLGRAADTTGHTGHRAGRPARKLAPSENGSRTAS